MSYKETKKAMRGSAEEFYPCPISPAGEVFPCRFPRSDQDGGWYDLLHIHGRAEGDTDIHVTWETPASK